MKGVDNVFRLVSKYTPSGDQPKAIGQLVDGLDKGEKHQVLLGGRQVLAKLLQSQMLSKKCKNLHLF